ncbi:fibronectin type III domain-containing protein [Rudanella paleaurantiibacter]|nr:fibronectin type III domain-containing protein [Rudanella paleaurantiibacter]
MRYTFTNLVLFLSLVLVFVTTRSLAQTCATPTSLTETEMTTSQIRLNWQAVVGVSNYTLQYREVGTTTWTTSSPSGSSTFWYISTQYGKTYEWQIRANCASGSSSFSPLRTFTMTCPVPFGQSEVVGSTAAFLQWGYMSLPNGSSFNYNLQWRAVGAATWITISNHCCSAYNLNNLISGQAYEWRMQTICPEGGTTAYTTPRTFTTGCGTPSGFYYYASTSTSIGFGWQTFSGVTYEIRWRPSGNSNTTWNTITGITTMPYTLTGLTNNTTYEVQARAVCSPTDASGWSNSVNYTTSCQSPWIWGQSATNSSAQINWTAMGSGTQYRFIWRAASSPTSTTVNGITTSPYTLTGLSPGTVYQYQIQTLCSDGNVSGLSSMRSFTTSTCAMPTSLTETEMTTSSIRLNWQSVAGVNGYTLRFREVGAANWFTYGSSTTGAKVDVSYGKTYEWQVQSDCDASGSSDFSPLRTVTITCPIPFGQSELTEPTAATLQWRYMSMPNGSSFKYNLQWRVVGGANWTTVSNWGGQSYSLSNLTLGQAYEWRIQTICPEGGTTAYTSPRSFTTDCGTPGALWPQTFSSTSMKLSWASFPNVAYELRWRQSGNASNPWNTITGITSLPYDLTGLTNNTTYELQTRAICSTTDASGWSNSTNYVTSCQTPWVSSFNITPSSAQLNWSTTGGGTQYRLIWQAVGSPTSTTVNGITTSPFTLTGLSSGTAYQYQMQTLCSDGNVSGLSSMQSFTTLACTTPTGLTEVSAANGQAQLRWNAVPGLYRLWTRAVGTTNWTLQIDVSTSTTGTQTWWVGNLLSRVAYEWQVELVCSPTQSVTASRQFTIPCVAPTPSVPQVAGTAAQLSWQGASGDVYQIRWRPTGAANWTDANPVMNPSYLLTSLLSGQSYEYQVQRICEGVATGYSASQTFTTGCNPPTLWGASPSARGANLYWSGLSGVGTLYEVQYRPVGAAVWVSMSNTLSNNAVLTNLPISTAYEWQVRMLCSDGNSSPFSAPSSFTTTACNPPTFTAENSLFPDRADLSVGTRAGEIYQIQWRQTGSATWANSLTFATGTWPVSVTGLNSGVTYEWRVQTVCDVSITSPFTTPRLFTTGCFPPSGLGTSTPTRTLAGVSWNGNSAYNYQVRWKRQADPTWTVENPVAQTFFILSNLMPGTAYEWQLQIICSGTGSGYSTSQTFTTAGGAAGCDALSWIGANSVSVQAARVTWTGSVQGAQTEVQWRQAGTTAWPNSLTFSDATTFTNLLNLSPNTGYQLRARTLCPDGSTSGYVTSWFTTRAMGDPVYTVAPGLWFTNTIWSYLSWPNRFDSAEIRHEVTLPAGNSSQEAKQIKFAPGGKLIFGEGAKLRLGF